MIGGFAGINASFFHGADTLASRIASEYQGAPGALQKQSLAYLGLILLAFALIVNVIARWIVRRSSIEEAADRWPARRRLYREPLRC